MIRPLRDRIVVEPLDKPLSAVLEVIQHGREGKHHRGRIVAVGPSVKFDDGKYRPRGPYDAKVGDVIQFTDIFRFPTLMDGGEKRLLLQEADISAIEESASEAA